MPTTCLPQPERRRAITVIVAALTAALALAVALPGLGNTILSWILCTGLTTATARCCYLLFRAAKTKVDQDAVASAATEPPTVAIVVADATSADAFLIRTTAVRVDFLDLVKTTLTVLVVIHHVTCAFSGTSWYYNIGAFASSFKPFGGSLLFANQSYFMSLFFLISGYFSVSSLDRKGAADFVLDKFKRLGIPLSAYLYAGGPITALLAAVAAGHTPYYGPNPGPCWFVAWLLLFSCTYAYIGGPPLVAAPRPHLAKLIGYGALLGVPQMACLLFTPGSFASMPIAVGSLPFDIAFFCAGVSAKRSQWFDSPLTTCERALAWTSSSIFLAVTFGGAYADYFALLQLPEVGSGEEGGSGGGAAPYYPSGKGPTWFVPKCSDDDDEACVGLQLVMTLVLCVAAGIFAVAWSAALLDLFQHKCNFRSALTTEMGRSAYTVYLIHPLVVVPLTVAWVALLRAGGVTVTFPADSNTSSSVIPGRLVWAGWAAVSCASLLCSWALAGALRRLPGFREVL